MRDSYAIKTCSCGKSFTALEWRHLKQRGYQLQGDGYSPLDMRDCPACGSTIALELDATTMWLAGFYCGRQDAEEL